MGSPLERASPLGRRRTGGSNPPGGTSIGVVLNRRRRSPLSFSTNTQDEGGTDREQAVRDF